MADTGTTSDEALLRRLQAGDEAAFATLYERLHGGVYRFALRMSGSPSVAEDVTQEVFLALIGEDRFDAARGSLAAFLYGIARNHVLRCLHVERPYVPSATEPLAPGAACGDALDRLIRRERAAFVWRALLTLPPHYREVVVLCELERLSYGEAAGAVGCPVGTVRSRLHRARELLGEKLRALDMARAAAPQRDA